LTVLSGVAALALAAAVYRPELLLPWVEKALAPRGGTASLSGIRVSVSPPTLLLSGLSIVPSSSGEGDLLRVDRLRIEWIPGRLFRGGPWVRHLEATGVLYERPRPREAEGPPDLTPITRLFDIEKLSLTDARLRVAVPQGVLAVDGLRVLLVPGEGGIRSFSGSGDVTFRGEDSPGVAAGLSARGIVTLEPAVSIDLASDKGRLDLPWISGDLSGQARLRVTRKIFRVEELILTLSRCRVTPGTREEAIGEPVRMRATASATLDGREPSVDLRGLDIGGLLLARGRLRGPTLDTIRGTLDGEIPKVERVRPFLAPFLRGTLAEIKPTGRLPWRIALSGGIADRLLTLELLPADMGLSRAGGGLDCRLGGTFRAAGTIDGWRDGKVSLSGKVRGTGNFELPPLSLRRVRFEATLDGAVSDPALPGWALAAEQGDVLYEGRPLPLGPVAIRGSARPAENSYLVDGVEIRSGSLGRLTGGAAYRGGDVTGRLEGEGLPADNLVTLVGAVGGYDWKGWSPAGAIGITARLAPVEGGRRVAAAVTLEEIGFRSPDGNAMGQQLAGTIDLEADLLRRPRMRVDLALRRGEALWGTVYLDLAKDPLGLRFAGERADVEEYEELLLEGALGGFGRFAIEGKARRERGSWRHEGRLALRDARLGPIFRTFLRDPLASSYADLAGLEMEGAAEAALSFQGTGGAADLAGSLRLRVRDLRRGEEPPVLSGLDLDLPISYALGVANPGLPAPSDAEKWGHLRIGKLRLSGQEAGPLDLPAILVPNSLHLGGTIDASLHGARLSLRRIRADEPLSRDFRIRMAAELDGMDLSRIAGKIPIEGRLGGVLDPVILGAERMTAAGGVTGDLFGGRLDVRRVTVERPFRPGREIGADVSVDRIDLERLSAALGVGRITGRLSGSIAGLRIAFGQPVAFHLKMTSVPAEGVDQSVSLKAVNAISLIGTGSSLSGMGISLMTKFFREFPYEKIGFECGLNNDVFTVRGLIREGGVEYLVKRRVFAGLDVINGNPDNRIGF
jgi:hypothetical protein